MIDDYNRKLDNGHEETQPQYEMEDDLLNEEVVRENINKHITDPGEKRIAQTEAQSLHDGSEATGRPPQYHKLEPIRRLLNQRILDDFSSNALLPLREAMSETEGKSLQEVKISHTLHRAQLALTLDTHRSRSHQSLITTAESDQRAVLASVNDTLTAAIDAGHIKTASHLLHAAQRSIRRSTTRFRRMCAADIA